MSEKSLKNMVKFDYTLSKCLKKVKNKVNFD